MLRRGLPFLAGLLSGLLSTALLLILISEPRGEPIELRPPPSPPPLRVHVSGAVRSPGVYNLPRGSIVADALEAAGGGTASARLSALNLAAPLSDGVKVNVPIEASGTEEAGIVGIEPSDPSGGDLLPINSATVPELETLPGIGPNLAKAITEYREKNGPFASAQELLDVPGIGPAKLAAIEDLIEIP